MTLLCIFSPGLETLQSFVDISLMELCHVGVHFWIVVPDVSLCASIWDGAEPKGRWEVVGTLELNVEEEACRERPVKCLLYKIRWRWQMHQSRAASIRNHFILPFCRRDQSPGPHIPPGSWKLPSWQYRRPGRWQQRRPTLKPWSYWWCLWGSALAQSC